MALVHREMLIDGVFFGGPCDQDTPKAVARSPYDGRAVGTVAEAGPAHADAAVDAAHRAFPAWRAAPRWERQSLLRRVAREVRERSEELAELLVLEIGKPISVARAEVQRTAITFDLAADLLSEPCGELLPADLDPRGEGHWLRVERFPVGPVLAIVPYNWPLNLLAHKVAPALAVGCTLVVKPSRAASLSSLSLVRILHECGCPSGVVNAVACEPSLAESMAMDPRIAMVSFTGSPQVGWSLKAKLPATKKVSLELGGEATAIVLADADPVWAGKRLAAGGFSYAGQVCISVQHILVEDRAYEEFQERMVAATEQTPFGDPADESVLCGPLIDSANAERVMEWVQEAESEGGRVLAGGNRVANVVQPTLIEAVPASTRLGHQEVFGPVVTLDRVRDLDEAVQRVNRSSYGIHTALFTHDLRKVESAFQSLETGGLVVNDSPSLRLDAMPYGGVKQSGFGREGVRYTAHEMTEPKALLVRPF